MSLIACCNGQSAFRNACNSLVSAKMEKSALAGLPQTLWHLPRDLREYPQTPKHFPWDLREYPQTPRQTPRDLRDSRRHQSISKSTLAVTALCPSHSSGIRSLILSFKLTLQRFLEREIRRRGHPFRSDRSFRGYTLLRSISEVPI